MRPRGDERVRELERRPRLAARETDVREPDHRLLTIAIASVSEQRAVTLLRLREMVSPPQRARGTESRLTALVDAVRRDVVVPPARGVERVRPGEREREVELRLTRLRVRRQVVGEEPRRLTRVVRPQVL